MIDHPVDYEKRYRDAVRVIQHAEWVALGQRLLLKGPDGSNAALILHDTNSIITDCAAFLDCHGEGHWT